MAPTWRPEFVTEGRIYNRPTVSLAAGTRLGGYEVLSPLGAGGMGEVYKARDTKLDRDVAIKVLPSTLAGDPAALARFEREAKAVAALSHPNILSIFDFGTHAAGTEPPVSYAVMELLEGETLRDRLGPRESFSHHEKRQGNDSRGLPARKTIEIATQIAHGLAAAHDKGVVHRDLKPENIFIASDGRAKILDFGLARQIGVTDGSTPTHMSTDAGVVMGTVGYMSPEQVRGQRVDHRSDIFSLGCVLFEMATGRRAFERDTPVETMTAILREDPPDIAGDSVTPPALTQLIRHCLEKRPEERFQSAHDLGFALTAFTGSASAASGAAPAVPAVTKSVPTMRPGLAALALLIAGIGFLAGLMINRGRSPAAAALVPSFQQLTDSAGVETSPTLSPDGRTVVYASDAAGNFDLYSLRVGGRNPVRLTDSPANDLQPAFSPDGDTIAFRSDRDGGGIFLMEATGESVRRLSGSGYYPSWSPTGREIVLAIATFTFATDRAGPSPGLEVIDVASGGKRTLAKVVDAMQPAWSPHGTRIAIWGLRSGGQRDLWTIAADGSDAGVAVTDDAPLDWNPTWSPDGRHLYFSSTRGGTMNLWRVPIDENSGRVLGPPEPVTAPSIYAGGISFSRDGSRLAFASLDYRSTLFRAALDLAGGSIVGAATPLLKSRRPIRDHEVSPDGGWIAFTETGGQEDLFVSRIDGREHRRLTDDAPRDRWPTWSPDGQRIAFYSDRSGAYQFWTIRPDGSGLEQMGNLPGANFPVWSPDGGKVAAASSDGFYIVDRSAQAAKPPPAEPPVSASERFWPFAWSPDGATLAGSTVSRDGTLATLSVYSISNRKYSVVSDSKGLLWQMTQWLPDSRRLLVRDDRGIAIVRVDTGERRLILPVRGYAMARSVGVTRDGKWITYTETATEGDIWMASFGKQ